MLLSNVLMGKAHQEKGDMTALTAPPSGLDSVKVRMWRV